MAYPGGSLLIRYRGTIGGAAQTWSFGLRVPLPTLLTQANLDDIALNLTDAASRSIANALITNVGGNAVTLTGVDVYQYASLPGSANGQSGHNFAPVITGTGDNMPGEVALVATLLSGRPGSSNRGRIYLPMTKVAALESSGQVAQTNLTTIGNAVQQLIQDVNSVVAAVGSPNGVSVISQTKGTAVKVTSVTIDSKCDSQRRREDKIAGAYRVALPIT